MRRAALFLVVLTAALAASAQDVVPQGEIGTTLIDLPSHLALPPSTLQVLFTHRFSETVADAGGYDLLGFDSAADVGIGVGYGLVRGLDVELYRSSFYKQLEGAVKWTIARQGTSFPLGLGLRVGADYRGARLVSDRWSGFAQLVAARRIGPRLDVFLIPMYASDTPTLTRAFNLGAAASFHITRTLDVEGEVIAANRDAHGGKPAWSVALNKRIPGHSFLVYVGNSRATTADLLVGSDLPGGFKTKDVRLGFNIVRRFPE